MKIITINKKARFDYEILDTMEAGIMLNGNEVKSIRNQGMSINDAFATMHGSEIMLINCHIAPYSHAYSKEDTSRRTRKLLLHRKEINKLIGTLSKKGLTLLPLKAYYNEKGFVKIELGLAKHKKAHDKRDAIKERDLKREAARETKVKIR
jgi:SsrA-binding protein